MTHYSPIERRTLTHRIPQFLTVLILIAFIGFVGHEVLTSPFLRATNLEIIGNEQVSKTAIRHLSNVRFDQHLFTLEPSKIEQQIEQHPWIRNASVSRKFPATIQVEIQEFKPALQLALQQLWYVDHSGIIFRKADSANINYPILTGIPQDWLLDEPQLVQKIIVDALAIYDACDTPLIGSADNISEIHFHQEIGFRVILRNGTTITFGFYEPESRVHRLSQMVSKGLDLSLPQQIELDADKVALAKPLITAYKN